VSEDRSTTRRTTDGLLGVGSIVGGAALVIAVRDLPMFDRTGPGPALAPAVVGAALVVCGLALLVSSGGIARVGVRWDRAEGRIGITLALLLIAAAAIDRIGIVPTAALLVLLTARFVAGAAFVPAVAMALVAGVVVAATNAVFGLR
jgi:hypothetical protein